MSVIVLCDYEWTDTVEQPDKHQCYLDEGHFEAHQCSCGLQREISE